MLHLWERWKLKGSAQEEWRGDGDDKEKQWEEEREGRNFRRERGENDKRLRERWEEGLTSRRVGPCYLLEFAYRGGYELWHFRAVDISFWQISKLRFQLPGGSWWQAVHLVRPILCLLNAEKVPDWNLVGLLLADWVHKRMWRYWKFILFDILVFGCSPTAPVEISLPERTQIFQDSVIFPSFPAKDLLLDDVLLLQEFFPLICQSPGFCFLCYFPHSLFFQLFASSFYNFRLKCRLFFKIWILIIEQVLVHFNFVVGHAQGAVELFLIDIAQFRFGIIIQVVIWHLGGNIGIW